MKIPRSSLGFISWR